MKTTYKAILFDLFGTLLSVSKAAKGRGQFTADILGLDRKAWNRACFSSSNLTTCIEPTSGMPVLPHCLSALDLWDLSE
ncbi:MAG: hypothetical protein B6D71_07800 [gamma proteobacterium symbiont of Stewartia floridana]|nr:MAG: hypothetical protein B6D71_07800 [gamma proteobacterium symbiont of Stewartia floridana]